VEYTLEPRQSPNYQVSADNDNLSSLRPTSLPQRSDACASLSRTDVTAERERLSVCGGMTGIQGLHGRRAVFHNSPG